MSAPNAAATDEDVEPHPYLHDWDTLPPRDYVLSWTTRMINGVRTRTPTHVKRVESCPNCPVQRVTHIEVRRWIYFKTPYYLGRRKGVRITRVSVGEWRRERFMRTTDLDSQVVAALEAAR